MTKGEKKIYAWKQATRAAIQKMKPAGFVELPGNKFHVMFDRELNQDETEMALNVLKLKLEQKAYAYTYNPNSSNKNMILMFDANVIGLYNNIIVYDIAVNEKMLLGIKDLQFKYKTNLYLYSVEYKG